MINNKELKIGMLVMISKDCYYSQKVGYEFWQEKKIRMKGTKGRIANIVPLGDKIKVIIDDWFFDSRDLTPVVTDSDFSDENLIEKNKIEDKTKVYFNPNQL